MSSVNETEPVISLQHVSKNFEGEKGTFKALDDVSLEIRQGDIFGIIGYSGAGKSTLLRMINALETPDAGRVLVNRRNLGGLSARELRSTQKRIGMIFQQFNLLNSRTVFENVAIPLVLNHESREVIRARVAELLAFVGLSDKADAYPEQLSGGQKQRVGIARALATQPDILLCDEATSALDPKTTESILELLRKVNRELGVTIVFVTHMINVITRLCNRVAVMEKGRVVEEGATVDVFSAPKAALTRDFVSTVIPDRIPEAIRESLKTETRPYRLIRFRFDNRNATDDVIWQINHYCPGVRTNVMFASVTELGGTVLSVIILQVTGSDEAIDAVVLYLNEHHITWEYVTP